MSDASEGKGSMEYGWHGGVKEARGIVKAFQGAEERGLIGMAGVREKKLPPLPGEEGD